MEEVLLLLVVVRDESEAFVAHNAFDCSTRHPLLLTLRRWLVSFDILPLSYTNTLASRSSFVPANSGVVSSIDEIPTEFTACRKPPLRPTRVAAPWWRALPQRSSRSDSSQTSPLRPNHLARSQKSQTSSDRRRSPCITADPVFCIASTSRRDSTPAALALQPRTVREPRQTPWIATLEG